MDLNLKESFSSYKRVFKIARKPSMKEYNLVARITGLGIIFIGLVGFLIKLIATLIGKYYG